MALTKNYFFVALVLTKWHETFSTQQESFRFWALALFWALVQRFPILSNNADDTQTYHRETGITKSNGWTSNQGGYNHDFKVLQNWHIPVKFCCGSCQFLNRNIIKNIQAPPTLPHPVHVFPVGNTCMNCIQFTLFVYSSFIYKDTELGWEEFPLCGPWQRSTLLVSDTCPQRSVGLRLSRNSFQMLLPKRHEKQSINTLNSIIEFWSDDITEMIFLKLWVLFDCSEQPIWKKFTCKSLAL